MVVVGDTPKLDVNDEHLFFLKYPTSGGGYTVDDDHILLTGGAQGLLTQISDNEYYNPAYNIIDSKDLVTKINDPNLRLTAEEVDFSLINLKESILTRSIKIDSFSLFIHFFLIQVFLIYSEDIDSYSSSEVNIRNFPCSSSMAIDLLVEKSLISKILLSAIIP